ncbi:HutP family protein [uncultured Cohaesibacter sp.]|uniref:HutP family protein n=1 Tax=uncultured Cohaesibacter sp. TaxID=1002546 RepID=UPI0029C612BC|nr:HutP family protein [uncultured Cohaesibacter sp.]
MKQDTTRIGKMAMLIAMSSDEEESGVREVYSREGVKIAVTYVSGALGFVKKNFSKTVVGSALHGGVVKKTPNEIHAVIHAGLEALSGIAPLVAGESQLKLKVAIVNDGTWLAVAAYGESAFHPETNHERIGFGIMHI